MLPPRPKGLGFRTVNGMNYSVVIPLKNEENNLVPLVAEVEGVMELFKESWELILIDDGSTDQTRSLIQKLKKSKPFIRLIAFDKNYGQSSAFDAGFRAASGNIVISLDGDGQNDPRDIPKLLEAIKEADLVVGFRIGRKDTFSKRITSKLSNFIRSRLCQDGVRDTGCSLKAYRKQALEQIKLFHGLHRFLPALFVIEGLRVKEVPVNHRPRLSGKSNYHFFNRSLGPLIDLLAVIWMARRRLQYQIQEKS